MEVLTPIFSFLASAAPALGAVSSAVNIGENLFGGKGSAPSPAAASPAPMTPASSAAAAIAPPGTSATDFTNQQNAYWQNLLAGTGISPSGELPADIQTTIQKQASLLGS